MGAVIVLAIAGIFVGEHRNRKSPRRESLGTVLVAVAAITAYPPFYFGPFWHQHLLLYQGLKAAALIFGLVGLLLVFSPKIKT